MSKLDALIAELCPEGVQRKPLVECGSLSRGGSLQKKDLVVGGFPAIHYGQIHKNPVIALTAPPAFVTKTVFDKSRKASPGDLIIADTSEDVEGVATATAWLGESHVAVSGHTLVFTHNLDPKFVSYFFKTDDFQRQKNRKVKGVKVKDILAADLGGIEIPAPPLRVQREIVSILDMFTALEAELEAELEARRTQLEETRKSLLFTTGSRVVPLSHLAAYSQLRIASHELTSSNFVGVDNLSANKGGVKDSGFVPSSGSVTRFFAGDVLLGNIRPYLRKIWSADRPGGCSGDVLCIRLLPETKGQVNPRYLYHCLASEEFFEYAVQTSKGAKMPRGDKASILKYPVHVPSLSRQSEIVSILDRLDLLVHDVTLGIPAEIAARRKQYDYYRNKLLTFKELETA